MPTFFGNRSRSTPVYRGYWKPPRKARSKKHKFRQSLMKNNLKRSSRWVKKRIRSKSLLFTPMEIPENIKERKKSGLYKSKAPKVNYLDKIFDARIRYLKRFKSIRRKVIFLFLIIIFYIYKNNSNNKIRIIISYFQSRIKRNLIELVNFLLSLN